MPKPDLKIAEIKPLKCKSPAIKKHLQEAVNSAMNMEERAIGYALVTFHENGGYKSSWAASGHLDSMDIPDMARRRLEIALKSGSVGEDNAS